VRGEKKEKKRKREREGRCREKEKMGGVAKENRQRES
jgi:hypothetical protein